MQEQIRVDHWDARGRAIADIPCQAGLRQIAVLHGIPEETVVIDSVYHVRGATPRREASIAHIPSPSPHRVPSICPWFGQCGGCCWQHVEYAHQLAIKESKLQTLFAPIVPRPIIGCKTPYAYRNKMEFSFAQDRQGRRFLGLFGRGQGVVNLTSCALASPWMSSMLMAAHQWWEKSGIPAYYPSKNSGALQTLILREGRNKMAILTVSSSYFLTRMQLNDFVAALHMIDPSVSIVLRIRQAIPSMPIQMYEMILSGVDYIQEILSIQIGEECFSYDLRISPQSFFQPNTVQAQSIYSEALTLANISEDDVVFDLYCGVGVFGMFAAQKAQRCIGIELSRESAYDAKMNSRRLGLGNISFYEGDTAAVLEKLRKEGVYELPTIVIVDPPRSGLSPKAHLEIQMLHPQKIVYVSCNPISQAHDSALLQQQGWTIRAIQPIDQFPQTAHVENIVLFEREF